MKYIAYGSNMNAEKMKLRCPDARLIGTGRLPRHTLEFRGRVPGNAHATVELSNQPGAYVPVAVWEISARDEQNLDYYEGHPYYYRKERRAVQMDRGGKCSGMIYIMNGGMLGKPSRAYYNGIYGAYNDLQLPEEDLLVLTAALNSAARAEKARENSLARR